MDLFGFKRRKAEREANARRRAEALDNATRVVRDRPSPPPPPARRRRPEAGGSEGLYGGRLYPHSSASGMVVDNTLASWAQPVSDDSERSSRHSDPGPASSHRSDDTSSSSGYTNTGSGYTNSDSSSYGGGSSDSGGGSFSSSD